jgi:geranyl-CoA carboxylase beta subunit
MPRFESKILPNSDSYRKNREDHLALIAGFRTLEAKIEANSNRALPKFRKRGQLLPRERLDLLLDRGSPFLEVSTLCGYQMHDDDGDKSIEGGGIGGIGFVAGTRCLIHINNSAIRGGAVSPMSIDKVLRLHEIAMEQKLPLIQLIESAGANLFRQADVFIRGGKFFYNLSRFSAMGLPVVGVTHGSSTAGGAYTAGLCDYLVVVRGRSKIFLAGPPLLKAATGEVATEEELGGAEMHIFGPGTAEYLAENDADGIRICRNIVANLHWNDTSPTPPTRSFREPAYDPEEILGIVPVDYSRPYDAREVIARIVDASEFDDFKPNYGPHTVCGHAQIEGHTVGIIANNGPIDTNGATKAAQFIQLCCQSDTPIVFLQNTTGFLVGKAAESGGMVKHGSKMIQAVSNATVPKITLHIGASFGAGNYGMCGRAYNPSFIFAWPNNQISVMGGKQAARTMRIVREEAARAANQEINAAELDQMEQLVIMTYEAEGKALFATARLWDDGLIDPRDSRRVLAFCLATCRESRARNLSPNTFGVGRM